ncbi:CocE/NonD family hydrolase [Leucobacter manosquensis]|uniref:CocE/NonD family hydrolase n=1 Tax=Leucobacter manosquensis TaxID=2810611 RepID=A0ABS5M1W3_9MICO|nr:CocE/NonD family hydrolase [Leucobacter manosquensis]MBS3181180.1 CocE/NonD family hydrolase [Leucobacter manosquensis]
MNGIITRPGVDPFTVTGKPAPPPLARERLSRHGLRIEKDLPVVLRDGVTIYVDAFLPEGGDPVPVLLAWGPYGKHWITDRTFPGADVDPEWISPLTGFEAPDPVFWCANGYGVLLADPRGLWHSEGVFPHNGPQERDDLYDTIEWIGAREWCTGSVGMLGVSYLAGSQYQAAVAGPPSLKAISPWECFSDWYREFATHGGIPETGFRPRVAQNVSYSLTATEDPQANIIARPLDDPYYAEKYGPLHEIAVPAYVVASWSDHGLHTRGTLNAFSAMGSAQKWLEVHGQKKWRHFYAPESRARQLAFFDTFLKGEDRGIRDWPRVHLEVRDDPREQRSTWRTAPAWPPSEHHRSLFLHAGNARLVESPAPESEVQFDPRAETAQFSYVFERDTELIGPMSLRLWLRVDDANEAPANPTLDILDADVFVAVGKLNRAGDEVTFPVNALFDDGPVALGWLRASHRAIDAVRSTALVPWHPHTGEQPLEPGRPVCLEVEIWAQATRFAAGETLVLSVQGRDFLVRPPAAGRPPLQILHEELRTRGRWTLLAGPEFDSRLRIPIDVPAGAGKEG